MHSVQKIIIMKKKNDLKKELYEKSEKTVKSVFFLITFKGAVIGCGMKRITYTVSLTCEEMDAIEELQQDGTLRSRGAAIGLLIQHGKKTGLFKKKQSEGIQDVAYMLGVEPTQVPNTSTESLSLAGIIAKKYRPWLDRGIISIRYKDVKKVLKSHNDATACRVYREISNILRVLLGKDVSTDFRLPIDCELRDQKIITIHGSVTNVHNGAYKNLGIKGERYFVWARAPHDKARWVKKGSKVEVTGLFQNKNGFYKMEATQVYPAWDMKHKPIRNLADEWLLTWNEMHDTLKKKCKYDSIGEKEIWELFCRYARMGFNDTNLIINDEKSIRLKEECIPRQPPGLERLEYCNHYWDEIILDVIIQLKH